MLKVELITSLIKQTRHQTNVNNPPLILVRDSVHDTRYVSTCSSVLLDSLRVRPSYTVRPVPSLVSKHVTASLTKVNPPVPLQSTTLAEMDK